MVKAILDYFSLWTYYATAGGRGETKLRQLKLFSGVLAGALSKTIFDYFSDIGEIGVGSLVVATIASFVVFPLFYAQAGLNRGRLTFSKWCLAFQHGFFWSVAMAGLRDLTT